ncbi:MAG: four helix bundle protein [Bacteroidota bacterium]
MHNFRELRVWKKARTLAKDVYVVSAEFPHEEKFGLTSQVRRSMISIPSNIAEGSSRNSPKDFVRFLRLALGSAFELETQLLLSIDLGFIAETRIIPVNKRIQEVQKMLIGLERKLSSEMS